MKKPSWCLWQTEGLFHWRIFKRVLSLLENERQTRQQQLMNIVLKVHVCFSSPTACLHNLLRGLVREYAEAQRGVVTYC